MRLLCAGVLNSGKPLWALPLHVDCVDAAPACHLASKLAIGYGFAAASDTTNLRQVVYPPLEELRKVLTTQCKQLVVSASASGGVQQQQPRGSSANSDHSNNNDGDDEEQPSRASQYNHNLAMMNNNNPANTNDNAESNDDSATGPIRVRNPLAAFAFSEECANTMLWEAEEYVKGDDKLCTSAAFVFYLVPCMLGSGGGAAAGSSSASGSTASSGGSSATTAKPSNVLIMWTLAHIEPEQGVQSGVTRVRDLANASLVLQRWAELAVTGDPHLQSVCSSSSSSSPTTSVAGGAPVHRFGEGTLAWLGASIEESMSEFGDARHASLEPMYAPES